MSASAVTALIVGNAPAARDRTTRSLAAQTIQIDIQGPRTSGEHSDGDIVVFIAAGTSLDATAIERLAWYLATHPSAAWVTGSVPKSTAPAQSLGALLTVCAVRQSALSAVLPPDVNAAIGHDATDTPGVVLRATLLLAERGQRGGWMQQPLADCASDTEASRRDLARAEQTLRTLGISVEALVDPSLAALPKHPLQELDSPSWPRLNVCRAPAKGHRILAVLQGFPMGGYTAFNADILPRLAARGHVITTVCTEWWRTNWRIEHVRATSPDMHHVPSVVPLAAMVSYVEYLIETRGIDIVFMSHSFMGYRMLPKLRARFPHVAFVDYVHTEWFESAMYGSYATMSAKWSSQLHAHIVSSRALADAMGAMGAEADAVHVAHIGIDTSTWSSAGINRADIRAALGASPDTTLLLFAGRISPEKRPMLAVDALEQLRAEGRDVRLAIAGDGALMVPLNAALEARGLAGFASLLGELDERTLRDIYAAADIYFAPSEIEGIARALFEAMAMECVPVVSDVGGQRELVVEGVGSLVAPEPATVEHYLPALRYWCDRPERPIAACDARRHIVDHFDTVHTIAALERAMAVAIVDARTNASPTTGRERIAPAVADELVVLGLEIMRRHVERVSR